MAIIGHFTAIENGYQGIIETLTFKADVIFEKAKKTKDSQPDYDVVTANGRDIGAAWERMGFLSVNIDDPALPAGNCMLKKNAAENSYVLTFQHRRDKKKD